MNLIPPPPEVASLPDHTQLPDSDGAIVENFQEHPQSILLTESLWPVLQRLHPDGQFAVGQDSGIYWRHTDPPLRGCLAPDWFYVPDVPPMLNGQVRRSYVLWQEMESPRLVVEFVSGDGSKERDRTPNEGKFWIYERRIRAGYYAIYEVDLGRVEVWRMAGTAYELVPANERGHYPIASMGIELGIWEGSYRGLHLPWLRCWDEQGLLLLSDDERAEEANRRADEANRRVERLAARLRELGQDPDAI